MSKRIVNTVAVVLIGIGAVSAFLIAYDRFADDDSISQKVSLEVENKIDAKKIAFENDSWSQTRLEDKFVTSQLLHIKNDGFTFVVDPESMEDTDIFMSKFSELEFDKYVWLVTIQNNENREWNYLIDAATGKVIQMPEKRINQFEPVLPSRAIETDSIISQAQGDVTVEFQKEITKSKSNPFPANLVITVGDTITWKNKDNTAHNVASITTDTQGDVGRIFESGIISAGDSFSFTADADDIGQIKYACLLHQWEEGSITVQENN